MKDVMKPFNAVLLLVLLTILFVLICGYIANSDSQADTAPDYEVQCHEVTECNAACVGDEPNPVGNWCGDPYNCYWGTCRNLACPQEEDCVCPTCDEIECTGCYLEVRRFEERCIEDTLNCEFELVDTYQEECNGR